MSENRRMRSYREIPIDRSQAKCLADVVMLYVRYAVDQMKLSPATLQAAEEIHKRCVRGEIIHNPRIVAAALVYIAGWITEDSDTLWRDRKVTYLSVSEALLVSEQAISRSFKQLRKKMGTWKYMNTFHNAGES